MNTDWIKDWIENHRWLVLLLIIGVILVGAGVFWSKTEMENVPKVEVLGASESAELIVDVSGEVQNPGVYKLPIGARVDEVLTKAGGLTEAADKLWVEQYLNKAAKISDGQKIYIPKISTQNSVRSSQTININTASGNELEGLSGVGTVTAQKIISGRPYQDISELVKKKILGQKVFDQIKDKISIW